MRPIRATCLSIPNYPSFQTYELKNLSSRAISRAVSLPIPQASVLEQPSADLYPNASQWYHSVSSKLAPSFPGKAVGVRIGQGVAAEAALAVVAKEAPAAEDDDDLDLFGDETEEEKKAVEQREAAKASTKKKKSGKSSVLMDSKPWDDETDMKKLGCICC
ncbi:elongation factor 1-beta 2-like [Coffea eugenioides]|nr:elongation factor 1-beta 2-like [Coffea eugenioides]